MDIFSTVSMTLEAVHNSTISIPWTHGTLRKYYINIAVDSNDSDLATKRDKSLMEKE
jgi:hypothetical protein